MTSWWLAPGERLAAEHHDAGAEEPDECPAERAAAGHHEGDAGDHHREAGERGEQEGPAHQDPQISRASGATTAAWARPARADAARWAGSSTFLPMALTEASSGETTRCGVVPSS